MKRYGRYLLLLLVVLSALCAPAFGEQGSPGEFEIRQAHLDWVAFTTETEMNAAITYIFPLYSTDTARLNALLADYKEQEALIAPATSKRDLENITARLRVITAEFRNESNVQMEIGHGKPDLLSGQVGAATTSNPYIVEREQAYWSIRRTNQVRDFDAWVKESQASLDTLKTQGFDAAQAQRTLDVIGSKRPDLDAALAAKSGERIADINGEILPLTRQLGEQVQEAQAGVSETERMQFFVEQGYRAVAQADQINNDLIVILLDIGPPETSLRQLKIDLAAMDRMLKAGNPSLAKTPFLKVKKDLKDLSMAYRDTANSASLPPDLTAALRIMVITLDNAADQMEVQ
ncbi:MAG: hypothetical protein CVV32_12550 [Methanomicrobiales archaeon HGW-Methanomicrobiales-3]|jgi:hypothetical protein|nr:MAG: hypothetical protein CVV32_12550 [Methanomicrobiales archaeon HGW-Methanomicrobiales-3]